MPLVNPLTVHEGAPVVVHVWMLSDAVTVYPVIAEPPLLEGAVQLIDAEAFPPVAFTLVGAPGTVAGVTAFDALEAGPVPTPLVAVTVNV